MDSNVNSDNEMGHLHVHLFKHTLKYLLLEKQGDMTGRCLQKIIQPMCLPRCCQDYSLNAESGLEYIADTRFSEEQRFGQIAQ